MRRLKITITKINQQNSNQIQTVNSAESTNWFSYSCYYFGKFQSICLATSQEAITKPENLGKNKFLKITRHYLEQIF